MNQLIISDYGTYLGKRSERVSVRYRDKDREKEEHALMDLGSDRHHFTRRQHVLRPHRSLHRARHRNLIPQLQRQTVCETQQPVLDRRP